MSTKSYKLSKGTASANVVSAADPSQQNDMDIYAQDPLYVDAVAFLASDGMTVKLTTKIATVTGKIQAAYYGVGLAQSGQYGMAFAQKTLSASTDGNGVLLLKGCATAAKPAANDKFAATCAAATPEGGAQKAQVAFSTTSTSPDLAIGKTHWASWMYQKVAKSATKTWKPFSSESVIVSVIQSNATAANSKFVLAANYGGVAGGAGAAALGTLPTKKAAYVSASSWMVNNPTAQYAIVAEPCQAAQVTYTATVTNDNKYDSTVAAYSDGIYGTISMKIIATGTTVTKEVGTAGGPLAANSLIGGCFQRTANGSGYRAVCFYAITNGGATGNMQTGKKTMAAFVTGASSNLNADGYILTGAYALQSDIKDGSATKKYAVEVSPAAGCTGCLVAGKMVTVGYMVPKTEAAGDPFKVANTDVLLAACLSGVKGQVKKRQTTYNNSQQMANLVTKVTQAAAATATVDGDAMASFAAGKCPEVKMLLTGLAKGTKVTDATEAKYTDGYKIKNSIKLGEGFATASSQIGVCYKSVTKVKNPAVCHTANSAAIVGNMTNQSSCYIKNDKWKAATFTKGDCTAQDASAKFTTTAPNTDNKAWIGGLNAAGDVVQATWNQPIQTETYAKSPRLSKDEMVAPHCIMGTTMSTPTAAGIKLTGAVALMTSFAGVAIGGIALSI